MKPCGNNRKLSAALALDLLEPSPAQELHAHLDACEGCRSYLEELTRVTAQLSAVEPTVELPASDKFHRRVMASIEARPAGPDWRMVLGLLRAVPLGWRVAMPLVAGVLLLTRLWIEPVPKTSGHLHPSAPASVQNSVAEADLAPTVANYQLVAGESPDKLDELLARQELSTSRATPVYTASSRGLSF